MSVSSSYNSSAQDGNPSIVAVIIPCYNEEITIAKVVRNFKSALPQAQIYVYDNNSTDNTAQLARQAGATVRHEPRQGKGNTVRAMLREIDADCYLLVDGDDTYPAEDAPAMVSKILDEGYDLVDGDRLSTTYFNENKRPFHNFGNKLVRDMINLLFGSSIRDVMTGYRAMSFGFAKTLPILSSGFELETEMTIFALDKNVRVYEQPVGYRDRPPGSHSKLNTVADGFKVVLSIVNLLRNYRPLLFFSIFGLISLVTALILSLGCLGEFMATRYITNTVAFSLMFIFAALTVTFFASGFVLSSAAKRSRQEYEVTLNSIQLQWALRKNQYRYARQQDEDAGESAGDSGVLSA